MNIHTLSDYQLQRDVQEQLEWEASIDATHLGVAAKQGIVSLTGEATSLLQKMTAEHVTKRVIGVRAVVNEIVVKIPGVSEPTDQDLAAAVLAALRWDAALPCEGAILVVVRSGWVTLEGTVAWAYQREAAERIVERLKGVRGVHNRIEVQTQVKTADIRERIEKAFHRSAQIDARHIHVQAADGKVVLRGHVRSLSERDQAQHAAWSAPGVCDVENQIEVFP